MDYRDKPPSNETGSSFNRRNPAKWVRIRPALTAIPKFVIGAGNLPPLPASDGIGIGLGGAMEEGQPVINSGDCIGAVVAGVCHGTPAPGAPTATCYGQMVGGVCTGPMF